MTSILSASSQATTRDNWTPYRDTWTGINKQEHREKKEEVDNCDNENEKIDSEQDNGQLSSLPSYNEVVLVVEE